MDVIVVHARGDGRVTYESLKRVRTVARAQLVALGTREPVEVLVFSWQSMELVRDDQGYGYIMIGGEWHA